MSRWELVTSPRTRAVPSSAQATAAEWLPCASRQGDQCGDHRSHRQQPGDLAHRPAAVRSQPVGGGEHRRARRPDVEVRGIFHRQRGRGQRQHRRAASCAATRTAPTGPRPGPARQVWPGWSRRGPADATTRARRRAPRSAAPPPAGGRHCARAAAAAARLLTWLDLTPRAGCCSRRHVRGESPAGDRARRRDGEQDAEQPGQLAEILAVADEPAPEVRRQVAGRAEAHPGLHEGRR